MATYREIQDYIRSRNGTTVKTCWIADIKERNGLPIRKVWNRQGNVRENPCPKDKLLIIENALRYFRMI